MGKPKKAPDMPKLPTRPGEVERPNVYVRLNPTGDEETVIKRKGTRDEETLNEISDDILGLIEGVEFGGMSALGAGQTNDQRAVNQTSPPQLVASRGDSIRTNGDTITNMTAPPAAMSTSGLGMGPTPADAPDISRARSPLSANARVDDANSKYISGNNGDGLDHGATHSEAFVGTGAIAITPSLLGQPPRKKRKSRSENTMTSRKTLNEWQPPFKSAGYTPGDHQMPKPGGKGVADREASNYDVGSYDTELSASGKEWPRDHNDTAAMCDVDDDGVEHKPQGSHESTHGDPNDGIQKKHGHNWPDQPKNSGQGVAEPFEGTRWSDGGTLTGGRGPGSDTWTHTEGPGMPSEGPITGTSGPQLGEPTNEGWTPDRMARMMGEEFDLQGLFNAYARKAQSVCLEDFQELCNAHGAEVVLDHVSMLRLMDANKEFMFYEGRDASGSYWLVDDLPKQAVTEGRRGNVKGHGGRKTLNEMQLRTPDDEIGLYNDRPNPGDPDFSEDPMADFGAGPIEPLDSDPTLGDAMGGDMAGEMECPGCGYAGLEAECPECGTEMMDPMGGDVDGLADPNSMGREVDGLDDEFGSNDDLAAGPLDQIPEDDFDTDALPGHQFENRIDNSPAIQESLRKFLVSARAMIGQNRRAAPRDLAEALNHSWDFYAGNVDANTCPSKVKQTLHGLMTKFPGFNPLTESDAMTAPEGTKLGGGDGPKDNLPKQPTNLTTHGDKSLLGKHQTNNLEGTPTISGTAKGMTGRSTNESRKRPVGIATRTVKENINRLSAYVKKQIAEGAKALRGGKFKTSFAVAVTEDQLPDFIKNKQSKGKKDAKKKPSKKRTPKRDSLAEALADAEEVLQFHHPKDVTFETTFLGPNGQVALKHDTPLFTIMPRGPVVGEGKVLFRFQRNAEAFADQLVNEGVQCRVRPHNWGSAVEAKTNYKMAARAFQDLAECGAGCAAPKKRKAKK